MRTSSFRTAALLAVGALALSLTLAACDSAAPVTDAPAAAMQPERVDLCHYDADGDAYFELTVAAPAEAAHRAHGDGRVGEAVPGMVGFVFDAACQPVACTETVVFNSDRDGNGEIYAVNADGTGLRNLSNDPATDLEPAVSGDGATVVFRSGRDGNNEIYAIGSDGTGLRNLSDDPGEDTQPSVSSCPGG